MALLDKREDILSRLFAILNAITDPETPNTVARNRGLLDNDARPALVLLDGDERVSLPGNNRGRQRMSPCLVTMMPQIFIITKLKKPQNEGIGELLNSFRVSIVKAIADDTELIALLGSNGDLSYDGCLTDLKTGSSVQGEMQLDFSLTTLLDPYR